MKISNSNKFIISNGSYDGSYGSVIASNYITTKSINDTIKPFVITNKKNTIKDKRRFRKTWKLK